MSQATISLAPGRPTRATAVPASVAGAGYLRTLLRAAVLVAAGYGLSATAQVSVGAAAAASAPGTTSSANGGVGGVGLGGVGQGVTVNPGVNSGAGVNAQGRYGGNNAMSGPRARANAERDLPPVADPLQGPQNSGQRAMALDGAYRDRPAAPAAPAALAPAAGVGAGAGVTTR